MPVDRLRIAASGSYAPHRGVHTPSTLLGPLRASYAQITPIDGRVHHVSATILRPLHVHRLHRYPWIAPESRLTARKPLAAVSIPFATR